MLHEILVLNFYDFAILSYRLLWLIMVVFLQVRLELLISRIGSRSFKYKVLRSTFIWTILKCSCTMSRKTASESWLRCFPSSWPEPLTVVSLCLQIKSQELFDEWVSKLRHHRLYRQNEIAMFPHEKTLFHPHYPLTSSPMITDSQSIRKVMPWR